MPEFLSPQQILNKGVYLWKQNPFFFPKDFFLNEEERLNHTYILWKKDSWKEGAALNLMIQDIRKWEWTCVIDQNWEYTELLLRFIPKERVKDVIYFDASEEERIMWINLYDIDNVDQASDVTELATEMLLQMYWPEIFWPRLQEYFKYWSLALLEDLEDKPTLLDVVRIFWDDAYRKIKLKKIKNPIVKRWWEFIYNSMPESAKREIFPYLSSKFVSFMSNKRLRDIIGQTRSAFDFKDVINNKKILLINLAKNHLGEIGEELLWLILAYKFKLSLIKGAYEPRGIHSPFHFYINNFQNQLWIPYEDRFNKASYNKVALTLIQDFTEQNTEKNFKKNLLDIINNTWNICIFNSFPHDAEFFEKEVSKWFEKKTIENLKKNRFLFKSKSLKKPVKLMGYKRPLVQYNEKIAPILQEYSRKKYGRINTYIEAEICVKYWMDIKLKTVENEKWEKVDVIIFNDKPKTKKQVKKEKKTDKKEVKAKITTSKGIKKTTTKNTKEKTTK